MRALLLAAVVAFGSTQAAQANITYNLSNVTLASSMGAGTPAGTLTGSFTTNDARSTLVAFNIVASAVGSFLGFTYTPATATVTAASLPSQYFQLDAAGSLNELRLFFTSGLSASGGTISNTFSYESERSGGNRFLTGSVVAAAATAVPEPASLALLGLGVAGIAAAHRRRTT